MVCKGEPVIYVVPEQQHREVTGEGSTVRLSEAVFINRSTGVIKSRQQ